MYKYIYKQIYSRFVYQRFDSNNYRGIYTLPNHRSGSQIQRLMTREVGTFEEKPCNTARSLYPKSYPSPSHRVLVQFYQVDYALWKEKYSELLRLIKTSALIWC